MPYDNLIHTTRQKLAHLGGQVLNIILPRKCAGCELENEVFCAKCTETSYKTGAQCLICGFRNKNGRICPEHLPLIPSLSRRGMGRLNVLWAGRYDSELKEAIWQLKYKKRKELAAPLAQLLKKKFDEIHPTWLSDSQAVIIPIPLHFKKEYERGFNQAELLAREFSKLSNIQCLTNVLIKARETPAQVEVENKELRIKNLENAFEVKPPLNPLLGKEGKGVVILIDDVATTGATLFHAAAALGKAGVKKIIGLVLAHGGQ